MLILFSLNIPNNQMTFSHHQVLNNFHQLTLTFIQHQKQWLSQMVTSLHIAAIVGQLDNMELSLENNEDN
eukprot:5233279-Amphidinium_carterae.1